MVKLDSTASTLAIAALVAVGISSLVSWSTSGVKQESVTGIPAGERPLAAAPAPAPAPAPATAVAKAPAAAPQAQPLWAASATGRIEPKDGELRIAPQIGGRIAEVVVKANDRVRKGDLLVVLDDLDARLKVTAAQSEVEVRKRERDDEPATGVANERRRAEDSLAAAEQAAYRARMQFDRLSRQASSSADERTRARVLITETEQNMEREKADLARVEGKAGLPLLTRLESALVQARAELAAAQSAVEKMHIHAPSDGTVLSVQAKVGELTAPSPELPLITIGDLSSLRVRAEVEERDATKVHVGQRVVVRGDAYPGKDFTGVVTSVSKALATPRIASRGPRRPNDVEVIEVLATLDGDPGLLSGMRVDVFFKLDDTADKGGAPVKVAR